MKELKFSKKDIALLEAAKEVEKALDKMKEAYDDYDEDEQSAVRNSFAFVGGVFCPFNPRGFWMKIGDGVLVKGMLQLLSEDRRASGGLAGLLNL